MYALIFRFFFRLVHACTQLADYETDMTDKSAQINLIVTYKLPKSINSHQIRGLTIIKTLSATL
jgi:hypothetical protein